MINTIDLPDLVKQTGFREGMQHDVEDGSIITDSACRKCDGNNPHLLEAGESEHALKMFYPQQLHRRNRNRNYSTDHENIICPLVRFRLRDDGINSEDSQKPNAHQRS